MNNNLRNWAKNFKGTAQEFIEQATERNFTKKSIQYWAKYNWNIRIK